MTTIAASKPQSKLRVNGTTLARFGPFLALALLCVLFSASTSQFLTTSNLSLIVQQCTVLGLLALGQSLIILTAGIDLSCGAIMALVGIVVTRLTVENGFPVVVAMAIGLLGGALVGALNGGLVAFGKLPAFIVTLGMLNICTAVGYLYSDGETIVGLPSSLEALGNTFVIGSTKVAYSSLVMVGLFVLFWFLLTKTAWGTRVHVVGDNVEAARLMGIPVRRVLMSVYITAGGLYAIASLLEISRTGAGDPYAGLTENLDAITAVVLGGTSLFGGRGWIWGTFVGVLVIGVLRNGLVLMGVDSTIQTLVTGILVILAVLVDQTARRRSK